MPNTPKDILRQQSVVPTDITKGTPLEGIGQSMTSVLSQVAGGLPELPTLPGPQMQFPGLPQLPTGGLAAPPEMPQVREFVKSIDSALPKGFPQVASLFPSAKVATSTNAGGANNPYPGVRAVGPSRLLTDESEVVNLPLRTFRTVK